MFVDEVRFRFRSNAPWRVVSLLVLALLAGCAGQAPVGTSTGSGSSGSAGSSGSTAGSSTGSTGSGPDGGPFLFPQLTLHGGRPLVGARIVLVVAQNDDLQTQLASFCSAITSPSYGAAVGGDYGLGAFSGCTMVVGASLTGGVQLTDAQMTSFVRAAIASHPSLAPDGNTMYQLILPTGVAYLGNAGCTQASGYHQPFGTGGDAWGVVQRCQSTFDTQLEQLTIVASHEILEAATDPDDHTGWGVAMASPPWSGSAWGALGKSFLEEVGDFCIGTRIDVGGVMLQRMVGNGAIRSGWDPCVPALPRPYNNVLPGAEWSTLVPGGTQTITLVGHSTQPGDRWLIGAGRGTGNRALGLSWTLRTATRQTIAGRSYAVIGDGETAQLEVTAPTSVASGDWVVIELFSMRLDATGSTPAGEDYAHLAVAGLYLP